MEEHKAIKYFLLAYILFFFIRGLYDFLAYTLTFNPLPTPSFLLVTPTFVGLNQIIFSLGLGAFFIALYVITRKPRIGAEVIFYLLFYILFIIFTPIIGFDYTFWFLVLYAIFGFVLVLTVIPIFQLKISKILWGISSTFYISLIFPQLWGLILFSVTAAGVELLFRKEKPPETGKNTNVTPPPPH
ncbi:hypothetical protein [Saccharolobus shibatae]|uniref:Uncharacterized protein n=1 Tax=Saccharolobus shibatae TaxID=2286 RepID=A0A8F5BT92_9CREN|nr:hypothetical protein [Saccharolobus shibatae]QXJ31017.1 hypothetical protein J5U21_00666 [Saccharolobus shibatae]